MLISGETARCGLTHLNLYCLQTPQYEWVDAIRTINLNVIGKCVGKDLQVQSYYGSKSNQLYRCFLNHFINQWRTVQIFIGICRYLWWAWSTWTQMIYGMLSQSAVHVNSTQISQKTKLKIGTYNVQWSKCWLIILKIILYTISV